METPDILKHKRRVIMVVRAVSAVSAFWFPFAYLALLDPPEPKFLLAPAVMKAGYTLFAVACLWWTLARGAPSLKRAQSIRQLFLRSLCCVQGTFLCATLGLLVFIADGPHLGSPLVVLPYVVAAVWVDWKYILPQMAAYQPTQADLGGASTETAATLIQTERARK